MNLKELKLRLLDHSAQVVVFDRQGQFVSSCHSLSDLSALEGTNVYAHFPLLAAMQETFEGLTQAALPVSLPAVEFLLMSRPGVFDFEFYAHPSDSNLLVWLLKDNTRLYRYLQEIQQERNELILRQETRKATGLSPN